MLLVKAWVGPSQIHGLGLIACEFIPEGTIVWRLVPGFDLLFTEEELQQLPHPPRAIISYYGHFDTRINKHVLSADDDRFTNHSDNANLRFLGDHSIAIRDIREGEEMTDNYNEYGKSIHGARE